MNHQPSRYDALGLEADWVAETLSLLPFAVTDQQRDALLHYVQLLLQWNRQVNLTAITDSREIWIKHILDSLTVLPYLQAQDDAAQYIDVGTGAGLPGIPLAVMQPQRPWRLVDSNAKKIRFLQQVRLMLALPQVSVEHQRTEKLLRSAPSVAVICRAYASPLLVTQQVQSWLKPGEAIYLLQGQAVSPLTVPPGYATHHYTPLSVPYLDASRHLWTMIKQA